MSAKVPVYRNRKLLGLARIAPKCFCCNRDNDGTVVAAHANMQSMGKGMGIKAADVVAFLCRDCHDLVDGRSSRLRAPNDAWAMAAVHSMRWAIENHPEVFR